MISRKEPKSKFIRIRCNKCKNEQVVFDRASTKVSCLVCNEPLAETKGGKPKIIATVLEVLE